MSFKDSSNQSGVVSELTAQLDIIKRGFMCQPPVSRDAVYDLIIDFGEGQMETAQVKTMSGNSITKIVDRSGEVVSRNGKTRNSLDYAAHGVDWLIGVSKLGEVFYYKLETYSQIPGKSFSVNKYPPDDFPFRIVPTRHALRRVS